MEKRFPEVEIGERFHDGKGECIGAKAGIVYWCEYVKVDKSTAKCVKQVGYGNTRMEGSIKRFFVNSRVWIIEE